MRGLVLPALVGLGGALSAVVVASLGLKYLIATLALLPGVALLFASRTSARLEHCLVALLALTIPVNLDVNFLFRPHIGGAPSISVGISTLCVLALLLVWLYRYRTGAVRPLLVTEPSIVWASVIYMAVGIMSLWNARHPGLVGLEELRLATLFVTMLVIMNLRHKELLRTFVVSLTVATFLQGALATFQYFTHSSLGVSIFGGGELVELNIGESKSRATGTTGHPNILGYYLESALPLGLALLLTERSARARLWYAAAFVATLVGLVTTLSRGAWLSVPVSCGFTLWVLYRRRLFRLRSGVGLSLMGVVLVAFTYLALPTIERRFFHDDYSSAATRMPLNHAALTIVAQYPVLGVGLNNFAEVFHEYDTTGYARIFTKRTATAYSTSATPYKHVVHNLVLWVWVEVGTVGLLAFLWVFGSAVRIAWKAYPNADEWSRAVLVACVAGMLGHFVHAQVDPGFRISPAVSMLFYSMFGLIGAIRLHQQRTVLPANQGVRAAAAPGIARVRTGLQASDARTAAEAAPIKMSSTTPGTRTNGAAAGPSTGTA